MMVGNSSKERDIVFVTPERARSRSSSESMTKSVTKDALNKTLESNEACEEIEGALANVMNARAELEMAFAGAKKTVPMALADKIRELFGRVEEDMRKVTVRAVGLAGRLAEREIVEARIEAKINRVLDNTREAISEAAIASDLAIQYQNTNRARRRSSVATYATAAAEKKQIVIVKGSEKQDSEAVKQVVIEQLQEQADNLCIKAVKKLKEGRVLIETKTERGLAQVKRCVTKEGYTVSEAREVRPRIIIFNVQADLSSEDLIADLLNKNCEDIIDPKFTALFKRGRHGQERNHVVLETTGEVLRKLQKEGRVYIGLDSCRVEEFMEVSRCYRCHMYGHVQKACKAPRDICGFCGEDGHGYKNCAKKEDREAKPDCVNCRRRGEKDRSHEANDRNCPEHTRATEALRARTSYA